jgi:hypothetical protein
MVEAQMFERELWGGGAAEDEWRMWQRIKEEPLH